MNSLRLYAAVANFGFLNYRAKIMVMAFLGTHIPLLGIIAWSVFNLTRDPGLIWSTLGVALVATLVGTGITLFVLNGLLAPVILTAKALRRYRSGRELMALPDTYTDEAGTLMADAGMTLNQLDATITELETTDPVTGLANRARFLERVQSASTGSPFAVATLRLASYRQLVSSFDQDRADALMRQLAARLRDVAGTAAHPARVDDQTFAIVSPGADPAELTARLKTIIAALSEKVGIEGLEAVPAISAGIARADVDGDTPEALLDAAAAAAASETAPKAVTIFSPAARDQMRERFIMEQELRTALEQDQFVLHYQPVVDMNAGKAVGAEALVRWNHPEKGLVGPAQFIPVAERSGLIDELGLWVMRAACAQLGAWNADGLDPLKIAVNLSASQFLDPRLQDQLGAALSDARVSPERLEIELTESAAMVDYDYTRTTFTGLKDLGVSVAIDDFGTGYASMSYLRKLPFDKLKIDREFVSHVDTAPDAQAICNAVIALTEGLGLSILAEGTERREEVAYLAGHGCPLFQGYYFSKPVPAKALPEVIADIAHLAEEAKAGSPEPRARRKAG